MSARSYRMLMLIAALSMLAAPSFAAEKKPQRPLTGTIKDLEKREIKVEREPPSDVRAEQAIEQYRKFLELQSNNDKMRAEAMRRLGDLQVEVDEGGRAAGSTELSGLEVKEAVKLYEGLLTA